MYVSSSSGQKPEDSVDLLLELEAVKKYQQDHNKRQISPELLHIFVSSLSRSQRNLLRAKMQNESDNQIARRRGVSVKNIRNKMLTLQRKFRYYMKTHSTYSPV